MTRTELIVTIKALQFQCAQLRDKLILSFEQAQESMRKGTEAFQELALVTLELAKVHGKLLGDEQEQEAGDKPC